MFKYTRKFLRHAERLPIISIKFYNSNLCISSSLISVMLSKLFHHFGIKNVPLTKCRAPGCGAFIVPHSACPECGIYKDEQVLD